MAVATSSSSTRASPSNTNNIQSTYLNHKKFSTIGNISNPVIAPLPLSTMQSPPLDLTSVERRGQPTASRESSKKSRPHQLHEAPTYRPSMEEFKDPFSYIKSIAKEASRYGICKIIPPDSWKPDFAIDTERFHFRTRKQELNSVEGSTRANLTYLDQLAKYHKQHGTNLNRFPSVDKRPLDLYNLKKAVEARGGFKKVCKLKKWAEIGRDLGYSGKIMSSLSTSLKNSYHKWLHPYEEYLRVAKPGVHQQLEYEYGGPLTPSPSPMKKSYQVTPSQMRSNDQIICSSNALNAARDETENEIKTEINKVSSVALDNPNTSGFTPVNQADSISANLVPTVSDAPNGIRRDHKGTNGLTPSNRRTSKNVTISTKNTSDYNPTHPGDAASTATFSTSSSPTLKRQHSIESYDSQDKKNRNEDGSRRSKRLKKNAAPMVAGSHMTMFRQAPPRTPGGQGSSNSSERCGHCGKNENIDKILTCESCENGYHIYCLDRQVTYKPDYDWHCPRCLVGDGQYGFEEGSIYSLKQFQEKAADFKEDYFKNKMPFDPVLNCPRPVTEDDIEREFWRLVTSLEETVEVEYGADIHSTIHGSGFPTMEKNPHDPYATDPWNLNIMPLHTDSLFRHIKSDISGMTVPWLYVGMIFSTFCWHNEDHYTYSANYQHFGSTKTWYAIPGEDAESFEQAMRQAVPELFETQPDLLFQLVTLLTPEQLKKAGVSVYALDQRAGQFVITFPQAYHAGFNHGFNFNEAVNFAPYDWEPFGDAGVERLQQFRRQPCFSHDELLWTAAEGILGELIGNGRATIETAKWLAPALKRLRDREITQRKTFLENHNPPNTSKNLADHIMSDDSNCQIKIIIDEEDVPEEEYQCVYCKAYCYLSRLKCKQSGKVLCLLHAGSYECCDNHEKLLRSGNNHTLHYRRATENIESMFQKISSKASIPDLWEEKFLSILEDNARPSLKALRALLSEGELIPYELKLLPDLKAFVKRCDEWVDEASNLTLSNCQNSSKNERALKNASKTIFDLEEHGQDFKNLENIFKLIEQSKKLGFQCPETILWEFESFIDVNRRKNV